MKDRIRQRALDLGFDECRFASAAPPATAPALDRWLADGFHGEMAWLQRNAARRRDPQLVLAGARSIVTVAASYLSSFPEPASRGAIPAAVARYACHADYHEVLAGPLKALAAHLDELGGNGTRSLWYVDTGPVLERDLAQRSGLGFAGKHTNLVSRQFGNWLILAEILTTLGLEPDTPEKNRCGSCSRCLAACPTQAFTAPFHLDARRCISYLTIEFRGPIPDSLRPAIGNRIFGCDDCLAACPWNRFAQAGRLMRHHARPGIASLDLLALLGLDEARFKQTFAGTPILRAKRRGLLRNVCVALGNVAGTEALPALAGAAADQDPLIAEHAQWAVRQIEARRRLTC